MSNGRVTIGGPQGHHLARVLRVHPGERGVAVANGREYQLEVVEAVGGRVVARIRGDRPVQGEAHTAVTLLQAVLPNPDFDAVVEAGTAVGIRRFIAVQAARSISRPPAGRLTRWQVIAGAAAEQSHRGEVPDVSGPLSLSDALEQVGGNRLLAPEPAAATSPADAPNGAADVCIINSCTVTAQADRKLRTMVHGLRRRHPKAHLILTGCHVDNPNPRVSAVPSVDVAFPNARKREIFDYVSANFAPTGEQGSTTFTRSRFFLKVQDGCNHRCTYCIVWRTRGASRSDDEMHLIERAQRAVADGHGEIVLTGVDLGAFGREHGRTLASFVRRLLAAIAPARLRLSSINANDFTPELVELTAAPRFCRHLHIPLQSGSDW